MSAIREITAEEWCALTSRRQTPPADPDMRAVWALPRCGLHACDSVPLKVSRGYPEKASYPLSRHCPQCGHECGPDCGHPWDPNASAMAPGMPLGPCLSCSRPALAFPTRDPNAVRVLDPELVQRLRTWSPKAVERPSANVALYPPSVPGPRVEAPPDPDLVWLDLETTGGNETRNAILELAVARTGPDAAEGSVRGHLELLVQPWEGCEFDPRARAVHGIDHTSPDFLRRAVTLRDALEQLATFLRGAGRYAWAGHNIKAFDLRFILEGFRRCGITMPLPAAPALDTLTLARRAQKKGLVPGASLSALRSHFSIRATASHRALADVKVNIQVYRRLRQREEQGAEAPRQKELLG